MRLFLARHGETDWNVKKVMQGQKETELTPRGIGQAGMLAKRLAHEKADVAYSSTLKRAVDTAEAIAAFHSLKPLLRKELAERSYGVLEGMKIAEMERRFPEEFVRGYEWQFIGKPEGGESFEDIAERVRPFLEEIKEKHGDENVIAVSHGDTNMVIIAELLGIRGEGRYKIRQDNACLNIFEVKKGFASALALNDTSHLTNAF